MQGISQKWQEREPSTQSPANKYLVLVVKNYAKADFKVFLFCSILLYFLTLFHKFVRHCRVRKTFKVQNTCNTLTCCNSYRLYFRNIIPWSITRSIALLGSTVVLCLTVSLKLNLMLGKKLLHQQLTAQNTYFCKPTATYTLINIHEQIYQYRLFQFVLYIPHQEEILQEYLLVIYFPKI